MIDAEMARWSGNAGWPVAQPSEELWNRIRSGTAARDAAESAIMGAAQPASYEALKASAGRAVRAGGEAFAREMFSRQDEYRDASGRRISYEAYLRLHGLMR